MSQLLMAIGMGGFQREVHGLYGDGTNPIAYAPLDMLEGLLIPLSEGSTGLTDAQVFWTGFEQDCDGWNDPNGTGTLGSSTATDSTWYAAGTAPCLEDVWVLCYCLSVTDPFG